MVSRCCKHDIFVEGEEYPYYVCYACHRVCYLVPLKGKKEVPEPSIIIKHKDTF